jgi:integrase
MFMPPPVAALVRLQLLTGARAGELFELRSVDIDRTVMPWVARPIPAKDEFAHRFTLTPEDLAAFERLMAEVAALDLLPDGGVQPV